ncbi:MAG: LysM peptidoglycan-binding domain-containing protein, partial [Dehalococcoidia bacterium]
FLLLPTALLALALLAAACGGGDSEAEPVPSDDGDTQTIPAPDGSETPVAADATAPGGDEQPDRPSAGNEALAPGADTEEPRAAVEYTVQAGDTLFDIAIQFDTTIDEIVAFNSLVNPDSLTVGQVIRIPSDEAETVSETGEAGETDEADEDTEPSVDLGEGDTPSEPLQTDTGLGTSPGTIPQPGPDVISSELPDRPADFADYGAGALPWLHTRDTVNDILPLFRGWEMPFIAGGDRLNLVDTDADGRSSLVIIYTDPSTTDNIFIGSNLIIYDPVPDRPDRYRIAYDHNLRMGARADGISVLAVIDVTGDGLRDITFKQEFCGASTCTASLHVLSREGDGYRDAVIAPIDIPTATFYEVVDKTGDGVADITIEGGTFGSVGAGPPRAFRFIFSAEDGIIRQVSQVGAPTTWLVWAVIDANQAFDARDFDTALALYDRAITDTGLEQWVAGEAPQLRSLAHLRSALAHALSGRTTAAVNSAQSAAAGSGLLPELSRAFLSGFGANADVTNGCAAFNNALALRVPEWDNFWSQFGYGVPGFPGESICPF